MSEKFIQNLNEFNRKERFYVVNEATEGGFILSEDFMKKINKNLSKEDEIVDRKKAFMAMDYHLDWIFASLYLSTNNISDPYKKDEGCIEGTQEDIDLTIAYLDKEKADKSHLIMIEAKGDTSWTNKQAKSKGERLTKIFNDYENRFPYVIPHFMIWSPNETGLKTDGFPTWALNKNGRFLHLELDMNENLKKIVLLKIPSQSEEYNYWKIKKLLKKGKSK